MDHWNCRCQLERMSIHLFHNGLRTLFDHLRHRRARRRLHALLANKPTRRVIRAWFQGKGGPVSIRIECAGAREEEYIHKIFSNVGDFLGTSSDNETIPPYEEVLKK